MHEGGVYARHYGISLPISFVATYRQRGTFMYLVFVYQKYPLKASPLTASIACTSSSLKFQNFSLYTTFLYIAL